MGQFADAKLIAEFEAWWLGHISPEWANKGKGNQEKISARAAWVAATLAERSRHPAPPEHQPYEP